MVFIYKTVLRRSILYMKLSCIASTITSIFPADYYLFKVNNRNTTTRCEICSKLTIKKPERRHSVNVILVSLLLTLNIFNTLTPCSSVSIVKFEQVNTTGFVK